VHALVALPVAKQLAEVEHATVHLIHVGREVSPPVEVLERIGLSAAELRGSVFHHKIGDASLAIAQTASELQATAIVMCTHTATAIMKTVGTTALAVLERARCPIVLVRPDRGIEPWVLRHVLLPHDGTPTTSAALHPAADLTRKAGAELVVLHVAGPGVTGEAERGSLPPPRYTDQPQHEWPAWAGEFLERLSCVCPLDEIRVRMALGHGASGDEVVRFATEHASDLVVLAWRGHWEGTRATTAKTIIRHAPCPVMVVRAGG
jgi:nucleotide-binding universal stress UspA family protein